MDFIQKTLLSFCLCICVVNRASTQDNSNSTLESFYQVILTTSEEARAEKLMLDYMFAMRATNDSLFEIHIKKFIKLVDKCSTPQQCTGLHLLIGKLYRDRERFEQMMVYFNKSKEIAQKHRLKREEGKYYLELGEFYRTKYQYNEALLNYLKAQEIFKKHGTKLLLAYAINNISSQHYGDGNYDKAIKGFRQLIALEKNLSEPRLIINSWNTLGLIDRNKGLYDKALRNYDKALKLAVGTKDSAWIGIMNGNIGTVYDLKGDYAEAERRYLIDQRLSYRQKEWGSLTNVMSALGDMYLKQGQYIKAQNMYDSTLRLCEKRDLYEIKERVYRGLSVVFQKAEKFEQANQYLQLYIEVRDSILRRQTQNKLEKVEMTYRFREQRNEIERLQNKNDLQNAWNVIITLVVSIVAIIALVLYRNNRIKQKNNEALKEKQEEITIQRDAIEKKSQILESRNQQVQSSIRAAFVIQNALLPQQQKLDRLLKNYFIFYRPRDVVSGDFYWVQQAKNTVYIGVLDCTGHGVPGAFMSLIANTLLDKVLREKHKVVPADILFQLHLEIRKALRVPDARDNFGLDMGLIAMKPHEQDRYHVQFAGAKLSLYYILPETNPEVYETANDRLSIGGNYNRPVEFTNYEFTFPKGSLLYLSTDGIADQNNKSRKSFTSDKLKNWLLEHYTFALDEQCQKLNEMMDAYMRDTEQRDDMLLIGIQLI
ncbi:hypothetical protein BKI52_18015 [marine bacterium AO1-C]|nr:hypothetical protein BKI52_18015 [marine bacterium AO1-C]